MPGDQATADGGAAVSYSNHTNTRVLSNGGASLGASSSTNMSATAGTGGGSSVAGTTSTSVYQPLSLADAMSRANEEISTALEEVLAERNKYCLEAGKLSNENMRIWNLMGRIRKENEALKAKLAAAAASSSTSSGGVPVSSSTNSPNAAAVSAAPLSAPPFASPDRSAFTASPPPVAAAAIMQQRAAAAAQQRQMEDSPRTHASHNDDPFEVEAVEASDADTSDEREQAEQLQYQQDQQQQQQLYQQQQQQRQQQQQQQYYQQQQQHQQQSPSTPHRGVAAAAAASTTPYSPVRTREPVAVSSPAQEADARAQELSVLLSTAMNEPSSMMPRVNGSALHLLEISVASSTIKAVSGRERDMVSFLLRVENPALTPDQQRPGGPPRVWWVEKTYAEIMALDARLRQKWGKSGAKKIAHVVAPEKGLFKDHAPSRVDQRKVRGAM